MVFYSAASNAAGAAGNVPSALVCEKPNSFLAQWIQGGWVMVGPCWEGWNCPICPIQSKLWPAWGGTDLIASWWSGSVLMAHGQIMLGQRTCLWPPRFDSSLCHQEAFPCGPGKDPGRAPNIPWEHCSHLFPFAAIFGVQYFQCSRRNYPFWQSFFLNVFLQSDIVFLDDFNDWVPHGPH